MNDDDCVTIVLIEDVNDDYLINTKIFFSPYATFTFLQSLDDEDVFVVFIDGWMIEES